ncbi:Histidine phosphatase superfamily [Naviculisporaceae sp. PSN 640]
MFWLLLVADRWVRRPSRRPPSDRYRLLRISEGEVRAIQIPRTKEEKRNTIIKTVMVAGAIVLVLSVLSPILHFLSRSRPSTGGNYPTGPVVVPVTPKISPNECDSPEHGFTCNSDISHSWGQYSPYFSLSSVSEISPDVPAGCVVTFAQVLSRHGARDPTAGKSLAYKLLIDEIHRSVASYGPGYKFLKKYVYNLGSDQLTPFGEQQMINSGTKFYTRYRELARLAPGDEPLFIRSDGQQRVVDSAENFMQGYHSALLSDKEKGEIPSYPYPILTIPNTRNSNNTLNHGLCDAFESPENYYSQLGSAAQKIYAATFTPPILTRLSKNLPGYNFTTSDVISLMDLCPFTTVAPPYQPPQTSPSREPLSPFCSLFTPEEWRSYDYYQTLGKWYGYGPGNPLGPTQGVGYVNELIARMTGKPVNDHTSTNSTLDSDPTTFPLDKVLYADFGHDNDMVSVLGALGIYDLGLFVSNSTRMEESQTGGFSARWTVPFAARIYFEKMKCASTEGELVRILVNDRVVDLGGGCNSDALGRCSLDKWVESLEFARRGGEWDVCFKK